MIHHKPIRKGLEVAALTFAAIAIILAACAFAFGSLPYRIGPSEYSRYVWSERLFFAALIVQIPAIFLGIASRRRLPITLVLLNLLFLFFCLPGGIHSGPNPQAWCYNNLRKIDAVKNQIAVENGMTNGVTLTAAQLSKYIDIEGGIDTLECAQHGNYMIGAIGTEPRCSVHGSMSEMEAGWKKAMQK